MVMRAILLIVTAMGLAGFGAVAWMALQPEATTAAAASQGPPVVQVLAAARTLRQGTLLKPDDMAPSPVPAAEAPAGASLDTAAGRADLLGAMVLRTVSAGEPLLPSRVLRAGERGFLSAVLAPGMRAATVGVDAISGTADLIWPGDHVDVILTQTIDDPAAPVGRRIAGETVLEDGRVIAIDQDLMQGVAGAAGAPGAQAAASGSRTVTLEVTPADAARVAVASRMGHLTLSVISAEAAAPASSPGRSPAAPPPPLSASVPAPVSAAGSASGSAAGSAPSATPPTARGARRLALRPVATPAVGMAGTAAIAAALAASGETGVTWGGDVSAALRGDPRSTGPSGVLHVFEGGAEPKEYRFQ